MATSQSFQTLGNLLKRYSSKTHITHTRIGDKDSNIYGGAYSISPDMLETFHHFYCEEVFNKKGIEYLTEKQQVNTGPILVDFDFRYLFDVDTRQHTSENIDDMIILYLEELKDFFVFNDKTTFNIFIMEKPHINRVVDKNITKDGIHMLIGLQMDHTMQLMLRERVLQKIGEYWGNLPLTNSWDSVLDEGISKGTTNWQLFGSRKPGNEAYELTQYYSISVDKNDNQFCMNNISPENFNIIDNFIQLSAQNNNNPKLEINSKILGYYGNRLSKKTPTSTVPQVLNTTSNNKELNKVEYFIDNGFNDLIKDKKNHIDLMTIGFSLKNEFEDDGLHLFLKIAQNYSDDYDEDYYSNKYLNHLVNKGENQAKLASIYFIFKKYNSNLYTELNKQFKQPTTSDDIIFVEDDNKCANIIFEEMKDVLIQPNGQYFLKVGNVWVCDKQQIDDTILNLILNKPMYKMGAKGQLIPYSQNVSTAQNIRKALYAKINTQTNSKNIYEKFHTTTKGRIAFLDGVLDFKEKKFYLWDDITFEYYTTFVINRKYHESFLNPNHELINHIKQQIFNNAFGNKTDTALHFLSRGIAGHYEDKNWATYLGNRDCGKGVLYDALYGSFENYVSTFELSNIQYQRQTNTDETSRKLYWLIDLQFVRLAISQEVPPPEQQMKTCGKTLKKITGGGDTIVARRNYDRVDTHFKLDTTFFMMGNNAIKVDVNDAMEHCIEFTSVNQFKTQKDIDLMKERGEPELLIQGYKVKDPTIKSSCLNDDDWKNAMVYLLLHNYQTDAVQILSNTDEDENTTTLRKVILTKCIITQNSKDVVLATKVEEHLKDCKKKIKNELESMGVIKKQLSSGEYRKKMCYVGLQLIMEDQEPENI